MDVTWEEPPPIVRTGRESKWADWLGELRRHPGRWALAPGDLSAQAARVYSYRISSGKMSRVQPGEFEAVTRTVDGQVRLYVRYGAQS